MWAAFRTFFLAGLPCRLLAVEYAIVKTMTTRDETATAGDEQTQETTVLHTGLFTRQVRDVRRCVYSWFANHKKASEVIAYHGHRT